MKKKHSIAVKELFYGGSILMTFGLIGTVQMFFFRLIAARYYGPSDFGLFEMAQTIFNIFLVISMFGIHEGITRFIPVYHQKKEYHKLKGYLYFSYFITLILSILCGIGLYTFSSQISDYLSYPPIFSNVLKFVAVVLPFKTISYTSRNIFLAKKRVIYNAFSHNVFEKGTLLIGAISCLVFKLNILWLIGFFCASVIIPMIYDLSVYYRKINFPASEKMAFSIKRWLIFSTPLLFMNVSAFLLSWTDNLVIGKILAPENLGVYSIAYSITALLLFFRDTFAGIFTAIIAEQYAKKDHQGIQMLFRKSQNWIFGITVPLAGFLMYYSQPIIVFLFGKDYAAGYVSVIVLSLGFLVNILFGINNSILKIYQNTQYLFKVMFVLSIVNLGLNIVLIPIIGILGAAISSALSIAIQNILLFLKAKHYEPLNLNVVLNLKYVLACVIAILFTRIILILYPMGGYQFVLIVVTGFLISYSISCILLKTFDREDAVIIEAIEKRFNIKMSFIKNLLSS